MTLVVVTQLVFWLLIAPITLQALGAETDYRWGISATFLSCFFLVVWLRRNRKPWATSSSRQEWYVAVPRSARLVLVIFTVVYVTVVLHNNLMYRRMGHEFIAEVYSQLSIVELFALRVYEVVYFPILFALLCALRFDTTKSLRLVLVVWFLGLLFTGILDSRSKLITPILLYYIFFVSPPGVVPPLRSSVMAVVLVSLLGAAMVVFIGRLDNFDSARDFAMNELLTRMDGLEFISNISSVRDIPGFGTLDPLIFTNFVSMIPFLEVSAQLKAIGLTSSKNYLLQVVLGTESFDINNSVVTDLFYFGGYVGLIIGAVAYASAVAGFDNQLKKGRVWRSRAHASLLFAFVINSMRVEYDFFSIVFAVVRDFFVIFGFFILLKIERYFGGCAKFQYTDERASVKAPL